MFKLGQVILSTALFLGSPTTLAEEPASEPALSSTSADAQLKWGPCPAFIPQGCEIAVLHGDPAKANADVFLRCQLISLFLLTGTHRLNAWCWYPANCGSRTTAKSPLH